MSVLTRDRAEKLEREVLGDFEEDYVGLWEIVRDVEDELGIDDPDATREATMSLVRDLITRGLIRPGMPLNDGGFKPWTLDLGPAAEKIEADWRESGRPSLEDAWFDLTPAGESYAKVLSP